jgi:hypothetical protein
MHYCVHKSQRLVPVPSFIGPGHTTPFYFSTAFSAALVPVPRGTCLRSSCLETALGYSFISYMHSNDSVSYNITGKIYLNENLYLKREYAWKNPEYNTRFWSSLLLVKKNQRHQILNINYLPKILPNFKPGEHRNIGPPIAR